MRVEVRVEVRRGGVDADCRLVLDGITRESETLARRTHGEQIPANGGGTNLLMLIRNE